MARACGGAAPHLPAAAGAGGRGGRLQHVHLSNKGVLMRVCNWPRSFRKPRGGAVGGMPACGSLRVAMYRPLRVTRLACLCPWPIQQPSGPSGGSILRHWTPAHPTLSTGRGPRPQRHPPARAWAGGRVPASSSQAGLQGCLSTCHLTTVCPHCPAKATLDSSRLALANLVGTQSPAPDRTARTQTVPGQWSRTGTLGQGPEEALPSRRSGGPQEERTS